MRERPITVTVIDVATDTDTDTDTYGLVHTPHETARRETARRETASHETAPDATPASVAPASPPPAFPASGIVWYGANDRPEHYIADSIEVVGVMLRCRGPGHHSEVWISQISLLKIEPRR